MSEQVFTVRVKQHPCSNPLGGQHLGGVGSAPCVRREIALSTGSYLVWIGSTLATPYTEQETTK